MKYVIVDQVAYDLFCQTFLKSVAPNDHTLTYGGRTVVDGVAETLSLLEKKGFVKRIKA